MKNIPSIRWSQVFFLASVVCLTLLAIINITFNRVISSAEARYQRVLRLKTSFVDMVSLENGVVGGGDQYAVLLGVGMEVNRELELETEYLQPQLIRERENVFSTLLALVNENRQFYYEARNTLPDLVDNVRDIHSYHLDNLNTFIRQGIPAFNTTVSRGFHRSADRAAPELEIINAAVEVQNQLLDVISVFYEMQLGVLIDNIDDAFQQRMTQFYQAVNRFDDYSIDAQDGLLAEKLLLTGSHFKKAFGRLLRNNGRIAILREKLTDNQQHVAEMFDAAAQQLQQRKMQLQRMNRWVQNASIAVLLLLTCWLLYYGIRLSGAFSRTEIETRRIREDLNYRIPPGCGVYKEFETLFQTLNALAENADNQVKSLEKMQRELGRRVQERTAELVHMNTRLKNEIGVRVQADQSRKELEAQLIRAKKMEAVGTLAGGVAHDLNNILSGVVTYPELLLLDMQQDDPLYKPLQSIKDSGERAASIVQDLLTLARRGVVVTEVIDIRELIGSYIDSPEFSVLQKGHPGVEVLVDLAESTGNVKGSRFHLQKAVMNIVANGMEAMPDGGTLTIRSKAVYIDTVLKGYDMVNEGDYACFSVSDTGSGMTSEVMAQIFEPFFTSKQMGRSGTGLGMAVVYSTVKDHGGYIDIDSTPGKGTTITVYFPLTREEQVRQEAQISLEVLQGQSEHILVVDDVFEQRQIAAEMLKRLNYTVASAASGEEAVAYLRENAVDLVVLDMIMPPGMDGFDTFMALKAVDPAVQVIIASGYSENNRVLQAQHLGAGPYIKKPYSIEVLGRTIQAMLAKA